MVFKKEMGQNFVLCWLPIGQAQLFKLIYKNVFFWQGRKEAQIEAKTFL